MVEEIKEEEGKLNFYSHKEESYGCFSNFYPSPMIIDDISYKTNEHYFQSVKSLTPENQEKIRDAKSPNEAAKLGRKTDLRPDWESVKDEIMLKGCMHKFEQNEKQREVLLGTGDLMLVEHTVNDKYWGDAGDGTGKNMLGKTLVQVRDAIRANEKKLYLNTLDIVKMVEEAKEYEGKLNFYSHKDKLYGCFSNYYPSTMIIDDISYKTNEHYFQSLKSLIPEKQEKIRNAKSPNEAKLLGRKTDLRPDWESVKDEIMLKGCMHKFEQNKKQRKVLLGTGDLMLVEHTVNDKYWGDAGDGTGKNMLGKILVKVRDIIRANNK